MENVRIRLRRPPWCGLYWGPWHLTEYWVLRFCDSAEKSLVNTRRYDYVTFGSVLIRMVPGSKAAALVHKLWCVNKSCVLTATNFVYAPYDSLWSLTHHVQFTCPQPSYVDMLMKAVRGESFRIGPCGNRTAHSVRTVGGVVRFIVFWGEHYKPPPPPTRLFI
jgi:hypothetical protein